jgi:adenylylsulfate kinase
MNDNLFEHKFGVTLQDRNSLNKHNSFLLFFTGLSGSGKSTLANALEQKLYQEGISTFLLDGDNIRKGINSDLNFTAKDRTENIRRIAHISNLFVNAGIVVLASFIAPSEQHRTFIKQTVLEENYIEIFVDTSIEECERRDVKGLYKKARSGEIKNFTGISAPYEVPKTPYITISTDKSSIEKSVELIFEKVKSKLDVTS